MILTIPLWKILLAIFGFALSLAFLAVVILLACFLFLRHCEITYHLDDALSFDEIDPYPYDEEIYR